MLPRVTIESRGTTKKGRGVRCFDLLRKFPDDAPQAVESLKTFPARRRQGCTERDAVKERIRDVE